MQFHYCPYSYTSAADAPKYGQGLQLQYEKDVFGSAKHVFHTNNFF